MRKPEDGSAICRLTESVSGGARTGCGGSAGLGETATETALISKSHGGPGGVRLESVVWKAAMGSFMQSLPKHSSCCDKSISMGWLQGVSVCILLRCYRRSWGWKVRAKRQLLCRPRALTARLMDLLYIDSPSDGAVLEAQTRTVPLPPCLSPWCSSSEFSAACLCIFLGRVKPPAHKPPPAVCQHCCSLLLSWQGQNAALSFIV